MHPLPARYDPDKVEAEARAFWTARALPPAGGVFGPASGTRVHEVFNALSRVRGLSMFLAQAVRADVEARYQVLAGRRAGATLLARLGPEDPLFSTAISELQRLAVWPGSADLRPVAASADPAHLAAALARLGEKGLLVRQERPLRSCPRCGVARPPPAIVYSDEEGPAYLVRFSIPSEGEPTSLIVWADSAWKLLGTSAILVHPDLPYVRARFRRRGQSEVVIVARSALPRLARWLEGAEFEVLDERPGRSLDGTVYAHPLSTEFPTLQGLPAPAGRVVAAPEVEDRGTGVVALVPAHGATDGVVAERLGIEGWPVLDPRGDLTRTLRHKYTGLTSDSAESFILRDLSDAGHLFAQVQVPRGLPRCAVCGSALLWQSGSVWALVPGALPAERLDAARRACPGLVVPPVNDTVPWPASELGTTQDTAAPQLRECGRCGRVAGPSTPTPCSCGGPTELVRRRLLPSFQEALVLADRGGPYAPGDPLHFFLAERSAGSNLLQLLVAAEGIGVPAAEFRVTSLPSVPPEAFLIGPSADADRAAFLVTGGPPRAGSETIASGRVQAARRLRQFWQLAREVLVASTSSSYVPPSVPIGAGLPQLPEEDRAFLSRFERLRVEAIRAYDAGNPVQARERLTRFFDRDLRGGYLPAVRRRMAAPGLPPPKVAALRVLHHVIPALAELFAPMEPYSMETILRAYRDAPESVFERRLTPVQEGALDAGLELAYERWLSFAATLRGYRREVGMSADRPWPSVVIVANDETVAAELRSAAAILARMGRVEKVEVASPEQPWQGRELLARPVPEEIQRAYGAQSGRILRILQGMPARRLQEGLRAGTLQISMEGTTRPILPTMVQFSESLPASTAAVPWTWGQLLVQVPEGQLDPGRPPTPALSPDGWRVVRAIRRRIERASAPSAVDRVVVAATAAVSQELERTSSGISALLGGIEVEVQPTPDGFPPAESTEGRTGRGARWHLWIPGLPAPIRAPKARPTRPRRPRVRVSESASAGDDGPNFLDPELLARENTIRATVEGFDQELGRPLMGPAKVSAAWDAGFRDLDSIAHAPFDQLAPVPGFGPGVAGEVVRHFGGDVPKIVRARPSGPRASLRREPPAHAVAPPPPPTLEIPSTREMERPAPSPREFPTADLAASAPPAPLPEAEVLPTIDILPAAPGPDPEVAPAPFAEELPSSAVTATEAVPTEFPERPPAPIPEDARAFEADRDPSPSEPAGAPITAPDVLATPPSEETPQVRLPEEVPPIPAPADRPTLPPLEEPIPGPSAELQTPLPLAGEVAQVPPPADPTSLPFPEEVARVPSPDGPTPFPPQEAAPSDPPYEDPTPPLIPEPAAPNPLPEDSAPPSLTEEVAQLPLGEGVTPGAPPEDLVPIPPPEGATAALSPDVSAADPEIDPEVPSAPVVVVDVSLSEAAPPPPPALESEAALPLPTPPASEVPPAPAETAVPTVTLAAPIPILAPTPTVAPPTGPAPGIELWPGRTADPPWRAFLDATGSGHRGICVSREFPDRLRAYLGPRAVEVYWLSNVGREGSIRPGDLDAIAELFQSALETRGVGAIYLDGLEYLVRLHTMEKTLAFLDALHQRALAHDARVWIPLNEALIDPNAADTIRQRFRAHATS
jgi:hypothetical protein